MRVAATPSTPGATTRGGPLDLAGIQTAIDSCLHELLAAKATEAEETGFPQEPPQVLRAFLDGGKRFRPLLCALGWHAAAPQSTAPEPVIRVAAALEVFHAFALIHDDVMDGSALRRGRPTVHRALAHRHRHGRGRRAAARLGVNAAILIGDIALAWSDELLHTAGLPTSKLAELAPIVDDMRTEVMYGQYLDLLAATGPNGGGRPTDGGRHRRADVEQALMIARYKTAKYTVERPLHVGAALAGAGTAVMAALTSYALPVGEAFQLRDDLIGAFGDPAETGKPSTDDLREGKHTALVALAFRHADQAQQQALSRLLGNPDLDDTGADRVRHILVSTGARDAVEALIEARYQQAQHCLGQAPFPPAATSALRDVARTATARTR